jgi:hypothetical protein
MSIKTLFVKIFIFIIILVGTNAFAVNNKNNHKKRFVRTDNNRLTVEQEHWRRMEQLQMEQNNRIIQENNDRRHDREQERARQHSDDVWARHQSTYR